MKTFRIVLGLAFSLVGVIMFFFGLALAHPALMFVVGGLLSGALGTYLLELDES